MNFIETLFGLAPDDGSGALEFMLFAIPIVGIYFLYRRRSKSRNKEE